MALRPIILKCEVRLSGAAVSCFNGVEPTAVVRTVSFSNLIGIAHTRSQGSSAASVLTFKDGTSKTQQDTTRGNCATIGDILLLLCELNGAPLDADALQQQQ